MGSNAKFRYFPPLLISWLISSTSALPTEPNSAALSLLVRLSRSNSISESPSLVIQGSFMISYIPMRLCGSFSNILRNRARRVGSYLCSLPSFSSIKSRFGCAFKSFCYNSTIVLPSKGCYLVSRLKRVTPHAQISPALP